MGTAVVGWALRDTSPHSWNPGQLRTPHPTTTGFPGLLAIKFTFSKDTGTELYVFPIHLNSKRQSVWTPQPNSRQNWTVHLICSAKPLPAGSELMGTGQILTQLHGPLYPPTLTFPLSDTQPPPSLAMTSFFPSYLHSPRTAFPSQLLTVIKQFLCNFV